MFEIEISERGSDKAAYVTLPENKNLMIDAMDKEKIFGKPFFRINICDVIPELEDCEFVEEPTLDELNFLAKRIEEISKEETQIIAYRALLRKPFDTINEAINRTYNLETVPVYPCKNLYAYGEIVLDNEFLEELKDVPDEIYELLDPDKVGRAMMEKENGVFISGYYAIADSYEPVLEYDEQLPERMEDWVFRLEVAGVPERAENLRKMKTEILTLPADEDHMQDIAEALGERYIDECSIMKFESALPQIDDSAIKSAEDIYQLNEIAWKFSDLSREDAVKLKAVLQNENWKILNNTENVLDILGDYDFDISVTDASDFGRKYLSRLMPTAFDRSLLDGVNAAEFAKNVLRTNGGMMTSYGAVSGYGGHLYSMIETQIQEQTADFKMGGMS